MMCGVRWGYLWITLLAMSLRRGLVFAKQLPSDTIGAGQHKTEFTQGTETQHGAKHYRTKFPTNVRAAITYRSTLEHDETEFVTVRTTLTSITYKSTVEPDETEFATDRTTLTPITYRSAVEHDETEFVTDRTTLTPSTYRSTVGHDKTEFVTDRTTLTPSTYRSTVGHDETEFATDIDATPTASIYVSVASATAVDPTSSSQLPCMTDVGTDRTSPSKTGLVTYTEKDLASTSETSPGTDVETETSYTKDMAGGFTADDEIRVLTTGMSFAGSTSEAPVSDITVGVTGDTNVTPTAVTQTLITMHSETMFTAESETEITSVSTMLASTDKMASDDSAVFIAGIAGGLGTVLFLTGLIAVYICRRRSKGRVSLRLSDHEGDFSRVYIHLHSRRGQEPMNQGYEASDKRQPSATQGVSGIYTEIADDLHSRRTLSAKGNVKASLALHRDYTSKTSKNQRPEQEITTNLQGKRRPSAFQGESRIYTEIPEVFDNLNTSPEKDPVPAHLSALKDQLYKRSKRRLQRPEMTPGLPRVGVIKRGPSLKKDSGIYTEITDCLNSQDLNVLQNNAYRRWQQQQQR